VLGRLSKGRIGEKGGKKKIRTCTKKLLKRRATRVDEEVALPPIQDCSSSKGRVNRLAKTKQEEKKRSAREGASSLTSGLLRGYENRKSFGGKKRKV